MWVRSVRSSPSGRQRRRDRSRIHRSLWPSHPAAACPRCLSITQQDRDRDRDREWSQRYPKTHGPPRPLQRARGVGGETSGSTALSSSYNHQQPPTGGPRRAGPVSSWRNWGTLEFRTGTQTHSWSVSPSGRCILFFFLYELHFYYLCVYLLFHWHVFLPEDEKRDSKWSLCPLWFMGMSSVLTSLKHERFHQH